MNPEPEMENDAFTEQLVAWDEALASGTTSPTKAHAVPTPIDDPRLAKGVACLKLLRQVRGARKSDSGIALYGWGSGSRPSSENLDSSTPAIDKQFGRFEIRQELGRGGYGAVFLAHDPQLRRDVALKVPHAGVLMKPELRARFKQEARAAAVLDHPHIVQVFEAGDLGPVCYIAAAYCPGTNLAEWLHRRRDLPTYSEIAELTASLADAVQHAHERGVWHRDLKPANIILQLKSALPGISVAMHLPGSKQATSTESIEPAPLNDYVARITDFGLAKTVDDTSLTTMSGSIVGTPSYMAPEQAVGKAHPMAAEADIYSLGAILYELLTGHLPFIGDSPLDTLRQVIHDEPVTPTRIRRTVPRDLETICLKCLEKDPRARYRSAQDLAEDLRRYLRSEPIRARSVSAIERVWRACRRKPMTAGLSTALALSIVVGLIAVSMLWLQAEQRRVETVDALNKVSEANQTVTAQRDQSEAMRYLHDIALVHSELNSNIARSQQILDGCRPEMRDWEWYYLNRLCHSELRALGGHTLNVYGVDVSSDGRLIATSSGQWGLGVPGEIFVWDSQSGERVAEFQGRGGSVMDVDFHPRERLLASGEVNFVEREPARIRIWDLDRKKEKVIVTLGAGIFDLEFSHDGRLLAAAADDGKIRLIETNTWTGARLLSGHTQIVLGVSFHPDDTRVASCSRDGTASIWDVATGSELVHIDSGHDLRHVMFSPDGRVLVTSAFMGDVQIWDASNGQELAQRPSRTSRIVKIAFSPDGTSIALTTRHSATEVWDLWSGELKRVIPGHYPGSTALTYTPDGTQLVTTGVDGQARVWDLIADSNPREFYLQASHICAIAIVPHTNYLATASSKNMGSPGNGAGDFTLRLYDQSNARRVRTMSGHTSWLTCVAASADGQQLASGSEDCTVRWWDVQTGKALHTFAGHTATVMSVAISPDKTQIVSASADHTVRVWDIQRAEIVRVIDAHSAPVNRVVFDPRGQWFASASDDQTIRIWDAKSFQPLGTLTAHRAPVLALAVSPDGQSLASGGREAEIHFWDTQAMLRELADAKRPCVPARTARTHGRQIACLSYTTDGKRLVSASLEGVDSTIRLWNVQTAQETLRLAAVDRAPASVVFSESGEHLFLSFGTQLQIFDARRQMPAAEDWQNNSENRQTQWHQQSASAAEGAKKWFAAAFHLGRLIEREPSQSLFLRRATAYAELARWSEASLDFERALALGETSEVRATYTVMRLSVGDNTSYRQLYDEMKRLYADKKNSKDANNLACVGAFAAQTDADVELLMECADLAVRESRGELARYGTVNTKALVQMRAKKYTEALATMDEAIRLHGKGGEIADWLLIAMLQQHCGQTVEARTGLEKAEAEMNARQAAVSLQRPRKDSWIDRMQNELLLREARELIR